MENNYQELYDMYQRTKQFGLIPKETTFDEFDKISMSENLIKNGVKPPTWGKKKKFNLASHNVKKAQISKKEQTRLRLLEKLKKKKESKSK